MGYVHKPRCGTLQFWPRSRAERIYPKISEWYGTGLQGFAAYKVGMTQYVLNETRKNVNFGKEIIKAATVLEVPPIYPVSLSFYKKDAAGRKRKVATLFDVKNLPKELKKDLKRTFNYKNETSGKAPEAYDYVKLQVATFPRKISLKKTPEVFELGTTYKLEEAKALLGKELKIADCFTEGEYVDVTAVTSGKGTQGPVKRFGIKRRNHHSKKGRRRTGSMGSTTPRHIRWQVPLAGQMGYNQRTELDKLILKISDKPEEVNSKKGFTNYGLVKGNFLLIDGSVPGPAKRMVILRKKVLPKKDVISIGEILK
jgi:large subunit ribosomal protein L3